MRSRAKQRPAKQAVRSTDKDRQGPERKPWAAGKHSGGKEQEPHRPEGKVTKKGDGKERLTALMAQADARQHSTLPVLSSVCREATSTPQGRSKKDFGTRWGK